MQCKNCRYFSVNANGETGECAFRLPPYLIDKIATKIQWTDVESGCDFGKQK